MYTMVKSQFIGQLYGMFPLVTVQAALVVSDRLLIKNGTAASHNSVIFGNFAD